MPRLNRLAVLATLAGVFLAGHLPFLTHSLEDRDSVNFALGVRDFDVARYQPHPPGYPIYIVLAKASTALMKGWGVTPATAAEAAGLALLSVLFGAAACVPLFVLFRACERSTPRAPPPGTDVTAFLAVCLTVGCPIWWFSAARPLSDIPGLAVTLVAQASLAAAFVRQREARHAAATGQIDPAGAVSSGRLLVLGALGAGVAIGFRSQALWLTAPLLATVLLDRGWRGAAGAWLGSSIALGLGVLAWLVPFVWTVGGPAAYLHVLQKQAGEDVGGVEMLWTACTPRLGALALWRTFVQPWAWPPLGIAVLVLALLGAVVLLRRAPRALTLLSAASLPYAAFHLVYQETVTTRYGLPLVPVVAYLAVRGASIAGPGVFAIVAVPVIGLALAGPAVAAFGRVPAPIARALAEIQAAPDAAGARLGMHFGYARSLEAEDVRVPALPSPDGREWLEIVRYWRSGGAAPVWFLADPVRNDLAVIEPHSQRVRASYAWPFDSTRFMGYVRPNAVQWIEMSRPGWMLSEGWALTPQIAGVARRGHRGPHAGGATAFVARRPEAATMLLGGRHLGTPADAPMRVSVSVDGQSLAAWDISPGFFLQRVDVPAGRLAGSGYARLEVVATPVGGRAAAPVGLEQFDLQSVGVLPMLGFGDGWHELEWDAAAKRLFRWSGARSTLRLISSTDVILRFAGESPLRYYDAAPSLIALAGRERLAELTPLDDFAWRVRVPAGALARSNGTVTITTDHTFSPADRSRSPDRRRLGVRFYDVTIEPIR